MVPRRISFLMETEMTYSCFYHPDKLKYIRKITERNTDPSLFTHCIEPKIAIVSINQNALAEY